MRSSPLQLAPIQSSMHEASAAWDVTVAEFLLQRGAEVDLLDSHGGTALHVAARTNHSGMVECLLLHGGGLEVAMETEATNKQQIHHQLPNCKWDL